MKYCPACKLDLPRDSFYVNSARYDGLSGYCVACQREASAASARALRLSAIAHLGGACARCGFDDPRALQFDHVRGGGTAERRNGLHPGKALCRRVLNDDAGTFSLLCANCNWIKRSELGELVGARVYERKLPVTETVTL